MDTMLAGRFLLRSELGRGGMGVVWHARDTALNREVAIKQILGGISPEREERVIREARLDHSGAVAVYDVVRDDSGIFIVRDQRRRC